MILFTNLIWIVLGICAGIVVYVGVERTLFFLQFRAALPSFLDRFVLDCQSDGKWLQPNDHTEAGWLMEIPPCARPSYLHTIKVRLLRFTSWISAVITIAPAVGMIGSLIAMSNMGDQTDTSMPAILAFGIHTTIAGLVISSAAVIIEICFCQFGERVYQAQVQPVIKLVNELDSRNDRHEKDKQDETTTKSRMAVHDGGLIYVDGAGASDTLFRATASKRPDRRIQSTGQQHFVANAEHGASSCQPIERNVAQGHAQC